MDSETNERVSIVVKSPYQKFPDQTIDCSIQWTVAKLKEEIANTCPTHPSVKEQRLIYWGKLLEDSASLKNTLKIYEEGQESNHTVHLVIKSDHYQPAKDGLRHRHAGSSSSPTSSSSGTSQTATGSASFAATNPFSTPQPQFPANTHPSATSFPSMHPVTLWPYYQYMQNHAIYQTGAANNVDPTTANTGGTGSASHTSFPTGANTAPGGIPGMVYDERYMQQMQNMHQAYAQYMQQYVQLMSGAGLGGMTGGSIQGVPLFQATQISMQQAAAAAAQQARAAQVNNNGENGDEERPRDWLDWFYFCTRALIFITIVCFYSSPIRFLLVLSIGFAVYLYQSGFFRYLGPAILIGNNDRPQIPVPNPAAPANPTPAAAASSTHRANTNSGTPTPSVSSRSPEPVDSSLSDLASTGPARQSSTDASSTTAGEDRSSTDSSMSSRSLSTEERATLRHRGVGTRPSSSSQSGGVGSQEEDIGQSGGLDNATTAVDGAGGLMNSDAQDRPTLLHLSWSIVANFFTSLLPEQTNLM